MLVSPQQQGTVCADSAVAMESEYRRESLEIWHINIDYLDMVTVPPHCYAYTLIPFEGS